MPRKKPLTKSTTQAPSGALVSYTTNAKKHLSPDEWGLISNDLWQGINGTLSERATLEQNLQDWTDLYEMRVTQNNWPWENASNVFIPVIPAQLDTAVAYIIGKVFVPRFYIVTGNTPDAAKTAHDVERYYNAELVRQRGTTTWYEQYLRWLHLAFRDGTAIMAVKWRKTKKRRKAVSFEPATDEDGVPVIDMNTGRPKMQRKVQDVEEMEYNDVELKPVMLKDFVFIPAEAPSVDDAVAVAEAHWLYESELMAMVEAAKDPNSSLRFSAEEVEKALYYDQYGTSEVTSDRQGTYDKTAGDQVQPGIAQGAQTSKFFANRGPMKVWEIHSRQYDMDQDGEVEENIFWLHELSQRMLGWMPEESVEPGRPYYTFCPYPRPDSPLGFALPERLAGIQAETNAMWNGRNNLFDLILSPPILYNVNEDVEDNEQQWGPAQRWPVTSITDSIKFFEVPAVPLEHFQNEQLLHSYTNELTGVSQPIMGGQSSGRRTATEMKQMAASTTTRNDLIAMRLRIVCRAILNRVHHLKLQYLDNDPDFADQATGEKFTLPREVLAKDYQLDISGSADPVDVATRRQENLALFELLMQVPFIAQDQVKQYNLVKLITDSFNLPGAIELIGTEEDAEKRQQEAEQQQQQMMAAQKIGMMLGGGKPPGGGQQPHHGKPHQGGVPPMAPK